MRVPDPVVLKLVPDAPDQNSRCEVAEHHLIDEHLSLLFEVLERLGRFGFREGFSLIQSMDGPGLEGLEYHSVFA